MTVPGAPRTEPEGTGGDPAARGRFGLSTVFRRTPGHIGRARTSTLVLALLFVGLGVLYLYVRPPDPATDPTGGTTQVDTPVPATTTEAPVTTDPVPTTPEETTEPSTPEPSTTEPSTPESSTPEPSTTAPAPTLPTTSPAPTLPPGPRTTEPQETEPGQAPAPGSTPPT